MEIVKLTNEQAVLDESIMAVIKTSGTTAILSPLDYGFEHHILIAKAGYP